MNGNSDLKKRAKKKFIGNAIAASLARLNSPLKSSYAKSCTCQNVLKIEDSGKLRSLFYCRARWCPTCQSIKMATMIDRYLPELSKLPELQFVTLTARTVRGDRIWARVEEMIVQWRQIADLARKKKIKFAGLRKTELKVANRGLFHCHFHLIISTKESADWLVEQWLRLNPYASKKAQKVQEVTNLAPALVELMKYTTKLVCADDGSNTITATPQQLDTIFRALYRRRLYQPFGGVRAFQEDDMDIQAETVRKAAGLYNWIGHDWIHREYGQLLSNWVPEHEELEIESYWKHAR